MPEEHDILNEILKFFSDKFEVRVNIRGFKYAQYKKSWLNEIGLKKDSQDEAKTAQTIKRLQERLTKKFGDKRVKIEAKVAENMKLRFEADENFGEFDIDTNKLMAFDILDLKTGSAFEISLADAYAEFFKDILKGLLDSRVKKLYFCMRNHSYRMTKGGSAGKSGYIKIASSPMIKQYISLARLYKLEIILVDIFPRCNR